MRYRALACDYDGTLATNGRVDAATLASLQQWIDAGRKLLLVTGRELPELKLVLPELAMFHFVVAENGGLLYVPATGETRTVAAPPPPEFVATLSARGVGPISVGHSIVATWHPHENTVLDTIQQMGLELQVIFNKGAVMILPSGVNKATGLASALKTLELSRHAVVAIGDAENDHAFLQFSRIGVAVDNALDALKQRAEIVTAGDHGQGVQQLIARLLADDLQDIPTPRRHQIGLPGEPGKLWSPGEEHLVITVDDADERTTSDWLLQELATKGYQVCRFTCDMPDMAEGSTHAPQETVVGSPEQLPTADEVVQHLIRPNQQVRVILCAHGPDDRRQRFSEIWDRLQKFICERGRPQVVMLPQPNERIDLHLKVENLVTSVPSVIVHQLESAAPISIAGKHQTLRARDVATSSSLNATP